MALFASGIKLADPLKGPLNQIKGQRQSALQDAIGGIQGGIDASHRATGAPKGQYIGQQIAQAGGNASRGIEDTLAGILGSGSQKDYNSELDYNRNLALAKEIGDAMSPSLLQEVLGGLGGAAGLGAGGYGLYKSLNKPSVNALPVRSF